jgi:hypothetical protein
MHLNIQRLSIGWRLSNFEPGCREAALHLLEKQTPPIDFWHQVDSDKGDFQLFMPALTIVSLLERYKSQTEIAMARGDIRKLPSAHLYSMVYATTRSGYYGVLWLAITRCIRSWNARWIESGDIFATVRASNFRPHGNFGILCLKGLLSSKRVLQKN